MVAGLGRWRALVEVAEKRRSYRTYRTYFLV